MPALNSNSAYYLIRDSLLQYSEATRFFSRENPLRFVLNGVKYAIQVNFIHDADRGNEDECRIQLSTEQIQRCVALAQQGHTVIPCGFYPDLGMFCVWEAEYVFARKPSTFSVYHRYSLLSDASKQGAACYPFEAKVIGRNSSSISFWPSLLGPICENLDTLFTLSEDEIEAIPRAVGSSIVQAGAAAEDAQAQELPLVEKGKIRVKRFVYARDPSFSSAVLSAYKHKCCVCGLDLKLPEAAHIVPFSHEKSRDIVNNGLALCPNHHRMYDSALILPQPDYTLSINAARVDYLKEMNISSHLESVEVLDGNKIDLPGQEDFWPNREFLELGCEIRAGTS